MLKVDCLKMNEAEAIITRTCLESRPATAIETALPDHLVRLPGSDWALWRWVAVRGAGFASTNMQQLASAGCAASADEVLTREDEAQNAFEHTFKLVMQALDGLRRDGNWDDTEKRQPLVKALRELKSGKLPRLPQLDVDGLKESFEDLIRTRADVVSARQAFQQKFAAGAIEVAAAIQAAAGDPRFREAVIWQNREAYRRCVERLLKKPVDTLTQGTQQRQALEMIANYLQRYCYKNDTIGFFGPVGWGKLNLEQDGVIARPGTNLLAERNIYFEGWCIDALADLLSKDKRIQPWLAPRRMAYIHLEGTILHFPQRRQSSLPPKEAFVLQACDGLRSAAHIALDLLRTQPELFRSEQAVYYTLDNLRLRGLISWSIELPIELYPERTLRLLLDKVEDESLRREFLAPLDELEAARQAVAEAAGNPDLLNQALHDLEERFARLTGKASSRSGGEVYAGRTLVYEDCRRDIEIDIGKDVVEAIAAPLSLLLTGARWFTAEAAKLYSLEFERIYTAMTRQTRQPTIPLVDFWGQARGLVMEKRRPVDPLREIFQERWAEILNISAGQHCVHFKAEELRPGVMSAFAANKPGWQAARYHSPDLMIAATSLEAIRAGDYQIVLGEIHLALNTLGFSLFLAQHPLPQELFQAFDLDMRGPGVVWILNKYLIPEKTARVFITLVSPEDYRIEITADSSSRANVRTVPIGELVVEQRGDRLLIRTRDGRLEFDLIEVFGIILSGVVVDYYKILRPERHSPRIIIDRFVVCRETWRFEPAEAPFALIKDEAERFLAARRWARKHDLPRHLFVKVPVEAKPFYVDFDSHTYVNIFARTIRRTKESDVPEKLITLTEMLPAPEQAWLPDLDGKSYECELRMAALDLSA